MQFPKMIIRIQSGHLLWGLGLLILLSACSGAGDLDTSAQDPAAERPVSQSNIDYDTLDIVTLLPRDGIPAIDNPQFLSAGEADAEYDPNELVLGVSFNGEARAYSIPFLSGHEIVNDTVAGVKIAVTW